MVASEGAGRRRTEMSETALSSEITEIGEVAAPAPSTCVKQTGPTSLDVTGDLTIRDQTRPVELKVEFEGVERAPWGTTVAGFSATAEINREDWGMTWNAALETGGVVVGKKVTLEIETELNPAQAKAA